MWNHGIDRLKCRLIRTFCCMVMDGFGKPYYSSIDDLGTEVGEDDTTPDEFEDMF